MSNYSFSDLNAASYSYIYVSIGGKVNSSTVRFNKPGELADFDFPTNALYQMVPAFIRYPYIHTKQTKRFSGEANDSAAQSSRRNSPKPSNILVIVIDDFSDPVLQELNQYALHVLQQKHAHLNIVMCNIKITMETIGDFAKSLVGWIVSQNISPEKCMIANFLRFRGCPSVPDAQIENILPKTIQTVLDKTDTYSGILYHWFGYQYYTYNVVYSYKEYNAYILRHLTTLSLFDKCCDLTQLTSGNVSNLFMFDISREPKYTDLLIQFLKYSVDITSYPKHDHIHSKMYEFAPSFILHQYKGACAGADTHAAADSVLGQFRSEA
jgi:hypothetical protein